MDGRLEAEQREWYGWQTLVPDASALGLLVFAVATDSPELGVVSLAREKPAEPAPGLVRAGSLRMTPGASFTRERRELYVFGTFWRLLLCSIRPARTPRVGDAC